MPRTINEWRLCFTRHFRRSNKEIETVISVSCVAKVNEACYGKYAEIVSEIQTRAKSSYMASILETEIE